MRQVTRGDATWNVSGPDTHASFWDTWEWNQWEVDTLDLVDQFVKPNTTFVDIGAWIGPVSLWAVHRGANRVVAIEPDVVAIEHLRYNVENNQSDKAVIDIIPGAISDHTGLAFIQPRGPGWGSTMTFLAEEGDTTLCWTLPDLWEAADIDNVSFVKMDIEGGESIVLEHAAPFLAELKIPMVVSIHEQWLSRPIERSWFDGYSTVIEHFGVLRDMTLLIP